MSKVKKLIKLRNSRNDLNILLKTFIIPQDEKIWNGHIVHVISRIPLNEYDEKYEPTNIGRICRIREEQKSIEYIYIYKLAHWRLLVWKVSDNSKNSKPFGIKTFYAKDYEIYLDGREPTEIEEQNGWNGKPEYYYNFKLDINDRFTIMGWKETQDFINKLIKDYDWIWDVRLDKEILV